MDLNIWFQNNWWWFVILWIWSLVWKIFALWRAAHKEDKAWFVALMILNTAGLLEIFYLFVFSQRQYKKFSEKEEADKKEK
jgi:membrane protein YdbS with pleckstrin-like domain